VEQRAIKKPLFSKLDKVIAVFRRLIIQPDNALPVAGFNTYVLVFGRFGKSG
jgi:hypothetical protein